jgi:hypothetical protein
MGGASLPFVPAEPMLVAAGSYAGTGALQLPLVVAMAAGDDARAAAYVECAVEDTVLWGVGVNGSIVSASLKAVVSAVTRAMR